MRLAAHQPCLRTCATSKSHVQIASCRDDELKWPLPLSPRGRAPVRSIAQHTVSACVPLQAPLKRGSAARTSVFAALSPPEALCPDPNSASAPRAFAAPGMRAAVVCGAGRPRLARPQAPPARPSPRFWHVVAQAPGGALPGRAVAARPPTSGPTAGGTGTAYAAAATVNAVAVLGIEVRARLCSVSHAP